MERSFPNHPMRRATRGTTWSEAGSPARFVGGGSIFQTIRILISVTECIPLKAAVPAAVFPTPAAAN